VSNVGVTWQTPEKHLGHGVSGKPATAGYSGVQLEYHCDYHATEAEGSRLGCYLGESDGYGEAARQVIGDRADAYLARLSALHAVRRGGTISAGAYLTAWH